MKNHPELKIYRPGGWELTEKELEGITVTTNTSILDVGCGNGATLQFLYENFGCKLTGIDASEKAVEAAKENCRAAKVITATAEQLPFENGSFDIVLFECSLPVIKNKENALKEAKRVLRPAGRIAASLIAKNEKEARMLFDEAGIKNICVKDCSNYLTQLIVDAIFNYGSLMKYLEEAEKELGGIVLDCSQCTKGSGYYLVTGTKD